MPSKLYGRLRGRGKTHTASASDFMHAQVETVHGAVALDLNRHGVVDVRFQRKDHATDPTEPRETVATFTIMEDGTLREGNHANAKVGAPC